MQLYRKADSNTKKAVINLLEGDSSAVELIGALLASKGAGKGGDSGSGSGAGGAADLLSSVLSGKTGGGSGSGKDNMSMLMDILGKLNK